MIKVRAYLFLFIMLEIMGLVTFASSSITFVFMQAFITGLFNVIACSAILFLLMEHQVHPHGMHSFRCRWHVILDHYVQQFHQMTNQI